MDVLKKRPDSGSRKELLLRGIEEHGLNTTLVDLIHELGKEHGFLEPEATPEEHRMMSSGDFGAVVNEAVASIEEQASDRSLLDREFFDYYLYLWRDAAGEQPPKTFLEEVVGDDHLLVRFLVAYTARSDLANHGLVEKSLAESPPQMHVPLLETFGVAEQAADRVEVLLHDSPKWLSDQELSMLEPYLNWWNSAAGKTT